MRSSQIFARNVTALRVAHLISHQARLCRQNCKCLLLTARREQVGRCWELKIYCCMTVTASERRLPVAEQKDRLPIRLLMPASTSLRERTVRQPARSANLKAKACRQAPMRPVAHDLEEVILCNSGGNTDSRSGLISHRFGSSKSGSSPTRAFAPRDWQQASLCMQKVGGSDQRSRRECRDLPQHCHSPHEGYNNGQAGTQGRTQGSARQQL